MEPDYKINLYLQEEDCFVIVYYFKEIPGSSLARIEVMDVYDKPSNQLLSGAEVSRIASDYESYLLEQADFHWRSEPHG